MRSFVLSVVSLCLFFVGASASLGVDVSEVISATNAECFKTAGLTYVIPRGYRSTGAVDTQVCTSIKNAAAAGITTRDTYMFPCKLDFCHQQNLFVDYDSIFNRQAQLVPKVPPLRWMS